MSRDRPKPWKFSVAAALLVLTMLGVGALWRSYAPVPASTSASAQIIAAPAATPGAHDIVESASPVRAPAPTRSANVSTVPLPRSRLALDRTLAANADLMPLLASALPDARRGDANAQYVAGTILQFCGDDPPSSTLEDKQQQILRVLHNAAADKIMRETAQHGMQSCTAIWQSARDDIGYGNDWLMHAAASGQPLAMLDQATSVDPSVLQDRRDDFLRKAIDSGNPEVLQMLSATALQNTGFDSSMQAITAALVACEFGADCARSSEQLQALMTDPNDARRYVSVEDFAGQQLNSEDYAKAANFVADFADRARKQALGVQVQRDDAGTFRLTVDSPPSTNR